MEDFENTVLNIINSDHSTRDFAENSIDLLMTISPDKVSTNLITIMGYDESQLTHLSAVLYRRLFIEKHNPNQDPLAKEKLLSLVQPFRSISFLRKIADILISLSVQRNFTNEILTLATLYLRSDLPKLKMLAFYILELAVEQKEIIEVIEVNSSSVFELMWKELNDIDEDVKISACKTTCKILASLKEDQSHSKIFSVILSNLQSTTLLDICSIIQSISELVEKYPRIISGLTNEIVLVMGNIAKNYKFSKESRSAAVEVLTQMINKCTDYVGKNRYFIQEAVTLAMQLMSELEFPLNNEEWNASIENETALLEPYDTGKELLLTISDSLKDLIYPDVIQLIDYHLSAAHWLFVHTGIIALGKICCGCSSSLNLSINKYTEIVTKYAINENPRLRYAALSTLSLFCIYFSPHMQNTYHQVIIKCFLFNIAPGNLEKLRSQAFRSMIPFCNAAKGSNPHVLNLHLPEIAESYFIVLNDQKTQPSTLQDLLESLSVVISNSSEVQIFQSFIPSFFQVFYLNGQRVDELKKQAMNCIGVYLVKNSFKNSEEMIREILKIKQKVCESDPCYSEIIKILCRITVEQPEVPVYFNEIIEELLKNTQVTLDVAVVDNDSIESNLLRGCVIEVIGMGSKKFSINTSAMETKLNACRLIKYLLSNLKEKISPWALQIFSVMKNLIDFKLNSRIILLALDSLSLLFKVFKKPINNEAFLDIYPVFLDLIQVKIHKFPKDVRKIIDTMLCISEQIETLSIIHISGAVSFSKVLSNCIKEILKRKNERILYKNSITDPGLYTEEIVNLNTAEEVDGHILRSAADLTGYLLKSFKTDFKQCFKEYYQEIIGEIIYSKYSSENDLVSSLCLFCDYIEHTGDLLVSGDNSLLMLELIKYSYHPSADVRQCAVFGIGLAALHGTGFAVYLNPCIESCRYIINLPNSFNSDLLECTECAINSLGKIALTYREDLIPIWVKALPFRSNPEEAEVAKALFLSNYERIKKIEGSAELLLTYKVN